MKITAIAFPAMLVLPGDVECVFDIRSLLCTKQMYDSSQNAYPTLRRYSYSVYLACLDYDNIDSAMEDGSAAGIEQASCMYNDLLKKLGVGQ